MAVREYGPGRREIEAQEALEQRCRSEAHVTQLLALVVAGLRLEKPEIREWVKHALLDQVTQPGRSGGCIEPSGFGREDLDEGVSGHEPPRAAGASRLIPSTATK